MPWETLEKEEEKKALLSECKRIAKKDELLCKLKPHLEYQFEFDLDKYAFLAIVMSKFDETLSEAFIRLVPDDVTEAEFWRNFFYHIELWKQSKGFESLIGEPVGQTLREAAVQEEIQKATEEMEKLKLEYAEEAEATSGFKVEDESANQTAADTSEVELQAV